MGSGGRRRVGRPTEIQVQRGAYLARLLRFLGDTIDVVEHSKDYRVPISSRRLGLRARDAHVVVAELLGVSEHAVKAAEKRHASQLPLCLGPVPPAPEPPPCRCSGQSEHFHCEFCKAACPTCPPPDRVDRLDVSGRALRDYLRGRRDVPWVVLFKCARCPWPEAPPEHRVVVPRRRREPA